MDLYYSLSSPKVVLEVVVHIGSLDDFEPVLTKGQQDQSQKGCRKRRPYKILNEHAEPKRTIQ